jgi:cytochrome c553
MRSIALVLLCALAALGACGGGSEPAAKGPRTGAQLYGDAQCVQCHGRDGSGTSMGPPLRSLGAHWTRESLAEYLVDPRAAVRKDPRLQALDQRYMMPMQAYPHVSLEERLALADHVLGF